MSAEQLDTFGQTGSEVKERDPTGSLEAIVGCMFSGKTDELLKRTRRVQISVDILVSRGELDKDIAEEVVLIFKPKIEDRYSKDKVDSHSGSSSDAKVIDQDNPRDILTYVTDHTRVVAVDEAQFFDDKLVGLCHELADSGIRVIVAGLDTDFRGETFGHMGDLVAQADKTEKFTAVCMVCAQNNATRTQRFIVKDGERRPAFYEDPVVVVGADELYEARCRKHHEVPKRDG